MTDSALATIKASLETFVTNRSALQNYRLLKTDTAKTNRWLCAGEDRFAEYFNGLGSEDQQKRCREIALEEASLEDMNLKLRRNSRTCATSSTDGGIITLDLNHHFLAAALQNSEEGIEDFMTRANRNGWEGMFSELAQAQTRDNGGCSEPANRHDQQAMLRRHYLSRVSSAIEGQGGAAKKQWQETWSRSTPEKICELVVSYWPLWVHHGGHDPRNTAAMGQTTLGPLSRQAMTVDWLNAKAKEYSDELQIAGVEAPKIVMMKDQEATLSSQLSSVELKAGWESTLDLYPLLVKSAELDWSDKVVVSVKKGEEYNDSVWPPEYKGTGGETAETAAAE